MLVVIYISSLTVYIGKRCNRIKPPTEKYGYAILGN